MTDDYVFDSYETLAARCERGADSLDHDAAHPAEVLTERGWPAGGAQQWGARHGAAAKTARAYAAELRAESAQRGTSEPSQERIKQARQVANAAELGGILIDGRPVAERAAQPDNDWRGGIERELWQAGTHPAQIEAAEIEATGKFVHVADTIDGIEQVPFWQLGGAADEAVSRRVDEDADEA